jgi:hypothetical protein
MPPMGQELAILNLIWEASLSIGGEAFRVERWSIARAGLGTYRIAERAKRTKGDLDGANA